MPDDEVVIRDLTDDDRPWLRALVATEWGLPVVSTSGVYADPERLEGVVAEIVGERAGAATFNVAGSDWEVVTLNAVRQDVGVGRLMLDGVRAKATGAGAARVWLITMDTDHKAIGFYEHVGMQRVRVHRRFIDAVRALKSEIAAEAFSDAIEFEWRDDP